MKTRSVFIPPFPKSGLEFPTRQFILHDNDRAKKVGFNSLCGMGRGRGVRGRTPMYVYLQFVKTEVVLTDYAQVGKVS